ncbi:MAG: DUF3379 family protein [Proteobacteria bacterium]|nr:DUF3379 family protein [Pseudomonadota bacterium]
MNCEAYRQSIAADPSFDGGAGHVAECAGCQAYRKGMLALDLKISRALALKVPELLVPELPDLEPADVVRLSGRRSLTPPIWLAMAATVLLAVALGARFAGTSVEYDSLADEVLAHLQHERSSLRISDLPVTDERLKSVVTADIARLDHSAGLITYARTCVIGGHDVPHLVIQGQRGPVTILLMPYEKIFAPQPLSDEYRTGVILPVGNGSIAIVGVRDEPLERIQKELLKSVMWST